MHTITTRPGEGERFQRHNRTVTIRLDLPELSVHEIEFDRTFEVPPHQHRYVDAMYVLDGEVECFDGQTVTRLKPGTLIAAPAGVRHGFRYRGSGRARVLVLHAPDGGFAQLVRAT